ncbi:cell envelope integrity EipB family protein [Roseibium sediminis]|uniref:cell envelope integrity EipB family protein n=1 Tax=Roseibium sediminis TaxID=1775174 RepID=UPI00123CBD03|nr:cell envelope integrity EipB family protein [Roseibium sediminis]
MKRLSVALLGSVLCVASLPEAALAGGSALAPHRAVYDMELDQAEGQSGIASLSGRMVYDFSGNSCDGYSVSFRFVTEFQDESGGSQVTDLQTTSFEAPDAKAYEFLSKTFVNQKLTESTRGKAKQSDDVKLVDLAEPEKRSVLITDTALFPTEHLKRVISSALDGTRFVAADVYDGSETGDKVFSTTAVIGAVRDDAETITGAAGQVEKLDGVKRWPVTIAYFDPSQEEGGEQTPVYQLTFVLYENGVSRELILDYGDFAMKGKLTDLKFYDSESCPN